jgi:predicted Zn-dependent protease
MFQLLAKDLKNAKQHLEKLRSQDRHAFETRYLAAQIALVDKVPDNAINELNEILKARSDPNQNPYR